MAIVKRSDLSKGLVGTAGEYLVAGELSRRGYIASLTLRNARGIDILVSDEEAKRSVGIQVKTKQGGGREWILSQKIEKMDLAKNLFFVFVNLNGLGDPEYFVIPRKRVADYASSRHSRWLSTPGVRGQQRKDSPIRKFADPEGKYLNRRDLLGLG
jgi:Holliday junction resolvase-like predicted endonuclease